MQLLSCPERQTPVSFPLLGRRVAAGNLIQRKGPAVWGLKRSPAKTGTMD